jgi:hypothetical protein
VIGLPLMVSQDIVGVKMHYQDRKVLLSCQGWIEKALGRSRLDMRRLHDFRKGIDPNLKKEKYLKILQNMTFMEIDTQCLSC